MGGRGGTQVDLGSLGLPPDLVARLTLWNAGYAEDKLPIEGNGDSAWIGQGMELLAEVRQCLAGRCEVVVTEPWWGEAPSD